MTDDSKKRPAEKQLTPQTKETTEGTHGTGFPLAPEGVLATRKIVHAKSTKEKTDSAEKKEPEKKEVPLEGAQPPPAAATEEPLKPKPFSFGADIKLPASFASLSSKPFAFDFGVPPKPLGAIPSPFANLSAPVATAPGAMFSFSLPPVGAAAGSAEGEGDENPESEVAAHEGAVKVAALPKEQLKTGEEDEDTLAEAMPTKLYKLEVVPPAPDAKEGTAAVKQWTERGRGTVKLNVHRSTKKARVLFRTEATLRLQLNVAVVTETKCEIDSSGKVVSLVAVEAGADGKPVINSYTIRFGQKEKAAEFHKRVTEQISAARSAATKSSSAAPAPSSAASTTTAEKSK